jgi:YVTN family beta-propeller protein
MFKVISLALLVWFSTQFAICQNAYIPNSEDNTVSVISLVSNSVIATIPVGTTPQVIAVSLNGGTVYIGNTASNSISVISTASNTVTSTIPRVFRPRVFASARTGGSFTLPIRQTTVFG